MLKITMPNHCAAFRAAFCAALLKEGGRGRRRKDEEKFYFLIQPLHQQTFPSFISSISINAVISDRKIASQDISNEKLTQHLVQIFPLPPLSFLFKLCTFGIE
jgi:hypothetical protein